MGKLMTPRLRRIGASLVLFGFLFTGALAGVGYSQARATTTSGTVTIRSIISGVLTFASGTQLNVAVGCTTVPYSFTGRLTTGVCSSATNTLDLYTNNIDQVSVSTTAVTSVLPLTLTGGTVTVSTPLISATQTWNAGGVVFTGLSATFTPTAFAANSKFINLAYADGTRGFFVTPQGAGSETTVCVRSQSLNACLTPESGRPTITDGTNQLSLDAASFRVGTASTGFQFTNQSALTSPADAQLNLINNANSAGIGFDVSTDSTLKIRTRAQSGYGTVDALAYNASGVAGVTGTCDTPTFTGGVATTCNGAGGSVDGTYFVTSNFSTDGASTALNLITGLQWTFPASTAINVPFRCSLWYSQATAAVSDSFGFQDVTVAPTNLAAGGSMETALGTTAYGDVTASSTTTATAVITATPSAATTVWNAYIDGMIEQPSNASSSIFKIMVKTTVAADVITVYRGSYCKVG